MKRATVLMSVVLLLAGLALYEWGRPLWHPVYVRVRGRRTVPDALAECRPAAATRLRAHFDRAGICYPPARVALLTFKAEKEMELWADSGGTWAQVRSYPIAAASGGPGPKLREGDRQVPEGVYEIIALNPNSSYHLSMELNYPNAYDREKARAEGRTSPGGDIFVHGKAVSIGCLAMGDEVIEELFLLVATVGRRNVQVLIAPNDIRHAPPLRSPACEVPWLDELYEDLRRQLECF